MPNNRNKILAFILGVLMSLVVLEVSLRVEGTVYSHWRREGNPAGREPGALAILCIGDSFTKGVGAPPGKGFPAQLEELLRRKYPQKKIQVIDKGVITFNTAEILEQFDENLNEINPDVIILLAGGANLWNVYGYGKYLHRNGWQERFNDLLYQVKTFKLIKLFLLDCQNEMGRVFKNNAFPLAVSEVSPEASQWRARGKTCQREGRYDEAVLWYKKQIESDPRADDGYINLISVYDVTRDKEGRRQVAKKLVELHPDKNHLKSFTPWMRNEDIPFLQKYERDNPVVGDILKARENISNWNQYKRDIKLWIEHDMGMMVRQAQRRGIQVILQDYPSYDGITPKSRYGFVNVALREVAEKNSVLFVDQERIFEEIFSKGERRVDYFEPAKVHCNEKGYGTMAENIFNVIINSHLAEGLPVGSHAK